MADANCVGINGEEGPAIGEKYSKKGQPSERLPEPKINVGINGVCAETEKEALRLSASRDLARLFNITGRDTGIPSPEDAANYLYQADEAAFIKQYKRVCVDGAPEQVKEGLENIAEMYQTPDLSVVTITHGLEERVHSYELLADVCGLTPPE